jgi:hypothetical protein
MTEVRESTNIAEALAVIDHGIGDMTYRTIMNTTEIIDLLLDVRLILTTAEGLVPELDRANPTSPRSTLVTAVSPAH